MTYIKEGTLLMYLANKHSFFRNTFFPSTIIEWNQLDPSLRNSVSYIVFKNLKICKTFPNNIFQCHNPKGIKLVTRLRLDLSNLRMQKFKQSFQDTMNSLFSCGFDIEITFHYFFHFPLFHAAKSILLSNIKEID